MLRGVRGTSAGCPARVKGGAGDRRGQQVVGLPKDRLGGACTPRPGGATDIAFVVNQLSARMIGMSLLYANLPRALRRSPVRALLHTLFTYKSRAFGSIRRNWTVSLGHVASLLLLSG